MEQLYDRLFCQLERGNSRSRLHLCYECLRIRVSVIEKSVSKNIIFVWEIYKVFVKQIMMAELVFMSVQSIYL